MANGYEYKYMQPNWHKNAACETLLRFQLLVPSHYHNHTRIIMVIIYG